METWFWLFKRPSAGQVLIILGILASMFLVRELFWSMGRYKRNYFLYQGFTVSIKGLSIVVIIQCVLIFIYKISNLIGGF